MRIDIPEIEKVLPHRPPFLLIDRIIELEPMKYAVGIKNISINEDQFRGHFPGHPIMPGVLILEAMAQVGGFALLYPAENRGKLAYFGGMDNVKFKKHNVLFRTRLERSNTFKIEKHSRKFIIWEKINLI